MMSEQEAVEQTREPRTRESLTGDLRALGVSPGMTLLVHSSLRSLGWVCGGPVAVVQALMDALTPEGTLVMPTQTGDLSEPSYWMHPPVPRAWWQTIRDTMPAYDPRVTPTRGMGRIVEVFRTSPNVDRSAHPQVSFAAWGRHAAPILAGHAIEVSLGEGSPLSHIYDLGGSVLLLGVGYDSNTTFHLAEYRAPGAPRATQGAPVLVNGQRQWQTYDDVDLNSEPFPEIGAAFERAGYVRVGRVGAAEARLFPQRAAVEFATTWLTRLWSTPAAQVEKA
jgi:aminoglycoside 3-N-acetyltransferase